MGAAPIGAPGCPEFAFCTASIDSVRMVSIASRSSVGVVDTVMRAGIVPTRPLRDLERRVASLPSAL